MSTLLAATTTMRQRQQRRQQQPTWRRYFTLILLSCLIVSCSAWQWEDFLGGGAGSESLSSLQQLSSNTLTMDQVREMRVRDIKRRLSRNHGYSADELGRILDKAELIQALSFEEHKERQKQEEKIKRALVIRGIFLSIIAIVVVAGWPVWQHLYAVASVNFVVYMDRKKYEAGRCLELRSFQAIIGVLLMAIVDALQVWLSVSILLSWFTSSRYFFPTPNLPIRPAAMMGGEVASGPLAKYGLNVGPMALSWAFRFVNGQLETFTGKALSRAYQQQKKEARQWESPEERAARKAARRAAKKAAKEESEQKKREEEEAEAKRRKEAAEKATNDLFGLRMAAAGVAPTGNDQDVQNEDIQDDDDRGFREQMDNMDMNDLD